MIPLAFPAVIVPPSRKAGFSVASFSRLVSGRGCSSRSTSPTGTSSSAKRPGLLGGRPATVALKCEGVLILAGDPVALGHVLAGLAHRLERKHLLHARIREAPAERRVPGRAVAVLRLRRDERRARHRLDAAGDEELAVSRANRMRSADDRREPRRAEAVHSDAGDALGQPSEQRAHARDVAVVLPGLVGGAEVDVLYLCRRDACPLHGLLDDEGGEVVRPHV